MNPLDSALCFYIEHQSCCSCLDQEMCEKLQPYTECSGPEPLLLLIGLISYALIEEPDFQKRTAVE